jgi:hypothetical protein
MPCCCGLYLPLAELGVLNPNKKVDRRSSRSIASGRGRPEVLFMMMIIAVY